MSYNILNSQAILGLETLTLPSVSWFITCIISTLVGLQYILKPNHHVQDVASKLKTEYDFIVVGSGSAGAVVANRLSEIPSWNVLLIEAGVNEIAVGDVPIIAQNLQLSNMDWQYKTEPQPTSCLAMEGGRCFWPRGKALGGSSAINAMIYLRGNRRDYDSWAEMGNTGWSYEDILPYFTKSEDNNNPKFTATPYHGKGGYLSVSDPPYKTPLADAFVRAGAELGYPTVDNNGAQQYGFGVLQGTIRNGRRCSTAKAFIRPVQDRPNLHIAMNTFVKKVNINPQTKQAESVVILRHNQEKMIKVRKEIILSAGAINSPHILMLSGVGRKSDLEIVGIPVIKNLNVGRNLQDHIALGGLTFLVNNSTVLTSNEIMTPENFYKYAVEGAGPLTMKATVESVGYVNTKYNDPSDNWPDMQLQFASGAVVADGGVHVRRSNGITDDFYEEVFGSVNGMSTWTVAPMLLRPKSKGYIKIISKNPFIKPLLYSNYLTHPLDIKVMREGVKITLALAKTKALSKFGSKVHKVPYVGCAHLKFMSDRYIECAIRQYTLTIYHQSGTCKMGPASDRTAVVDPQLRVHGIGGLRVIDASIMPNVVSSNTNAPVIMIGERGSDLVKESYGF